MKKILMATAAALVVMSTSADAGQIEKAFGMASVMIYHKKCEPVPPKVKAALKAEMVRMTPSLRRAVETALPKLYSYVQTSGGDADWCAKAKPIIDRLGRSPQRDRRRLYREISYPD